MLYEAVIDVPQVKTLFPGMVSFLPPDKPCTQRNKWMIVGVKELWRSDKWQGSYSIAGFESELSDFSLCSGRVGIQKYCNQQEMRS